MQPMLLDAVKLPSYETFMYSPNSFPPAFVPSRPLAFICADISKLSLKLAQGAVRIIYITTEPGCIRQGWGSIVPAAVQPLSTKTAWPKEISILSFNR